MVFGIAGHGEFALSQLVDHGVNKLRPQERNVTGGEVGGLGLAGEGFETDGQSRERSAPLFVVAMQTDVGREPRNLLTRCGDDDDRSDDLPQESDDALEQHFLAEGEGEFRPTHAGTATAAEYNPPDGHVSFPGVRVGRPWACSAGDSNL